MKYLVITVLLAVVFVTTLKHVADAAQDLNRSRTAQIERALGN